ncbi:MAG: helix-turn-helix transcriptional regulator [Candidatus Omnitrophota bacterium]
MEFKWKTTFAEVIKERRKEKGYTFEKLSKLTGISAGVLNRYEKGKKYPSLKTLPSLCSVLELDQKGILSLIQSEKVPLKNNGRRFESKYSPLNIFTIFGTATQPHDLFTPSDDFLFDQEDISLYTFRVNGNFLSPLILPGQKVFIDYPTQKSRFSAGHIIIVQIKCIKGNYTSKIREFKKANNQWTGISIEDGFDTIAGKLIKADSNLWRIEGLSNKKTTVDFDPKDIVLSARVMGALFYDNREPGIITITPINKNHRRTNKD